MITRAIKYHTTPDTPVEIDKAYLDDLAYQISRNKLNPDCVNEFMKGFTYSTFFNF